MKAKKKTKEQIRAGKFLELHSIVHFMLTEQRVPVIFEGRLAYVKCPGVSKESFKKAIYERCLKNIMHLIDRKSASTHET